jgi:riboflavin synthase
MFTGIIEAIGTVREFVRRTGGARTSIAAGPLVEGLRAGDSIAVDGACLTATAITGDGFTCDLSDETLRRTTLGSLRAGSRVNLERPLRLGDRLGGHLVAGHVDAVGEIVSRTPEGDGEFWRFRFPREWAPLLVMKGSIAVDGISLTVADLTRDTFGAALIPHTLRHTTLGSKRAGDPVNLEADLLAKHVARLLAGRSDLTGQGGLTLAFLEEHGFA